MSVLPFYLLCLISVKTVFGLECYATDAEAATKRKELVINVQNCDSLIGQAGTRLLDIADKGFVCYKVVVEAAGVDVEVKGCTPKGGCDAIKQAMTKRMPSSTSICYECDGNLCNSASRMKVFGVAALLAVLALVF